MSKQTFKLQWLRTKSLGKTSLQICHIYTIYIGNQENKDNPVNLVNYVNQVN